MNIYDGALYKNSQLLVTNNYFWKSVLLGSKYATGSLEAPCNMAPVNSFNFQYKCHNQFVFCFRKWNRYIEKYLIANVTGFHSFMNTFCITPLHNIGILQIKSNYENFLRPLLGLRNFLATESPVKMIKNPSYFTLKAFFVLKIFKLLSWFFSHVEKQLGWKDKINFKID